MRAKGALATFKNTVFGFLREHEKKDSSNYPAIIKYLILNYYLLEEKFHENDQCIDLSKNGLAAYRRCIEAVHESDAHRFHWGTVHGVMEISDGEEGISEYEWVIQVNRNMQHIAVGLATIDSPKHHFYSFPSGMYGMMVDNGPYYHSIKQGALGCGMNGPDYINTLHMRLNLVYEELSFSINKGYGHCPIRIGKCDGFKMDKYRLIIMLQQEPDFVVLKEFKIKQSNNENKRTTYRVSNKCKFSSYQLFKP